ncbi:MAG: hypothetical protein II956_12180 [Bacteroidales bacterium]|nr:hypothetical protein [Bacteroidales bacterium]
MVKKSLFLVIRIVTILITFFNSAFAQSKHTALWNFSGDFYLDFATKPATEKDNNPNLTNAVWYVDSEGEIALVVKDYQVYNKEMVLVENSESFTALLDKKSLNFFFIPVPTNENLVYLFQNNNYILIDVNANQVISEVKSLDIKANNQIAVRTSDCKGVWLIYYDKNGLYKYLITEYGISKQNVVDMKGTIAIKLSKDCKHFVINSDYYDSGLTEYLQFNVRYGDFDDGNFFVKNEFVFPITRENKFNREGILDVIISEDNSKIFYTSHTRTLDSKHNPIKPYFYEIYKADIISGIPDYENAEKIYSEEYLGVNQFTLNTAYYGIDGRIYIFNRRLKKYFVIYFDDSSNIQVEPRTFNFSTSDYIKMWFVSSWFSENPCNGNDVPCSGTSSPKIICE